MKIFLILIILFNLNNVNAANADMQMDIEIPNTSNLTRGDVVPFTLTVTNNGPDYSDYVAIIYNDTEINNDPLALSNLLFTVDDSIEQECVLAPLTSNDTVPSTGPDTIDFYFVLMPDLPANTSISCYGLAHVLINKTTKIDFHVTVRTNDNDDDLSNNTQSVVFSLKPPTIPLLNKFSLFTLTILIFLIGFKRFNTNNSDS